MQNYLYVEIDEEITTVIGKLKQFNTEQVFIVVPKGAIVSGSLVNLKLLEKEARRLNKKLIFVSPDPHVRKLAEKAGLSIKKYVAKPKEEKPKNVAPIVSQPMEETRKLTGWEEEEAKKELGKIIKGPEKEQQIQPVLSNETTSFGGQNSFEASPVLPGSTPFVAPITSPPPPSLGDLSKNSNAQVDLRGMKQKIKVPVGVFSNNKNNIFLDQKKVDLNQQDIQNEIKKDQVIFNSKKINSLEERTMPMESVSDSEKTDNRMDIGGFNQNKELKNEKKVRFAPNPFKTKPLKQNQPPAPVKNIILSSDNSQKPLIASPDFKSPVLQAQTIDSFPKKNSLIETLEKKDNPFFQKDLANLTLKEKERLKDLWMEQRGKIRSRVHNVGGEIDLKKEKELLPFSSQFFHQEGSILKTMHQKIGSESGKIVDLRASRAVLTKEPLINLENLEQINRDLPETNQKSQKNIILPVFNIRLFLIFLFGILFVLAIVFVIVLPQAEIEVKIKKLSSDLDIKAEVSGEVAQFDPSNALIPGKPFRFKVKKEGGSGPSSQKEVKEKVKGQVVVYNNSDNPLSLKAGALLKSADGKRFISLDQILVPKAKVKNTDNQDNTNTNGNGNTNGNSNNNQNNNSSQNEVREPGSAVLNVESEQGGKEFAMKSGSLSLPGLSGSDFEGLVTAEVKKEITGGGVKTVNVISKEDIEKVKNELRNDLTSSAASALIKEMESNSEIQKNLKPLPPQIAEENFSTDKKEGDEADSFSATMEITFYTLFFNEEDIKSLLRKKLSEDEANKASLEIKEYSVEKSLPLENKAEINAKTSYTIVRNFDLNDVKKQVTARKKKEAEDFLKNNQNIESFNINLWPNFMPNMPLIDQRIKVKEL